jgi:hypothetical protein
MILLVVWPRPVPTVFLQSAFGLELHNCRRITGVLVGVHEPRGGKGCSCQGFGQKSSGRLGVPIGREQKVDRRAGGVKSSVQVPPFTPAFACFKVRMIFS